MQAGNNDPVASRETFAEADQIRVAPPPARSRVPTVDLAHALEGTPITMFGMDRDLRYSWIVNLQPPWSEEELVGRTDEEALGVERGAPIMAAKRRVLETGRPETVEIDISRERQRHWYELTVRRDETMVESALICTALDISEKKRREIMLQALLREVSHRSKNLLAMVLSIASQTSRKSFDKQTFLSRFTGRMQSLARSQDSITGSDWRGAALSELIENQVAAALPDRRDLIRHEGPDIQLTPNAALHVGLALHELTTNAINHGTLGSPNSSIVLRVDAEPRSTSRAATIEWHESSDQEDWEAPAPDSFGMVTLKRLVPAAVGGKGKIAYKRDGLHYTLTIEPSQFDYLSTR